MLHLIITTVCKKTTVQKEKKMETKKQEELLTKGSEHKKIVIFNITAPNSDYDGHTNTLVGKMIKVAKQQKLNVTITMESASKVDCKGVEADILLLSPSMNAMKDDIQETYANKVVKVINEKDYGFLQAENILKDALS